jgi:hypothetical protein
MTTRGIPEIPIVQPRQIVGKDGTVHMVHEFTPQHYQVMVQMRQQMLQIIGNQTAPPAPTNLKVTGQGLSNLVQFTRVSNADTYEVAHAATSSLDDPHLVITSIGNSQQWADVVGSSGVTVFYWVRARKATGAASDWTGPVKAATGVATVGVPSATPPPPDSIVVVDTRTGNQYPYRIARVALQ